jgi:hypothetical protein
VLERVVAHGIQADVDQVGKEAAVQVGRDAPVLLPVPAQFVADVDVCPGGEPWPPVDEPGCVVQVVPVQGVAPVDDGGDPRVLGEYVPVDQVSVDDVAMSGQVGGQFLQPGVTRAEGAGTGGGGGQGRPPAGNTGGFLADGQQGLGPGGYGSRAIRRPDAVTPAPGAPRARSASRARSRLGSAARMPTSSRSLSSCPGARSDTAK